MNPSMAELRPLGATALPLPAPVVVLAKLSPAVGLFFPILSPHKREKVGINGKNITDTPNNRKRQTRVCQSVWGTGLARFERAACRLGGGCSILLSYSPKLLTYDYTTPLQGD
jgi:hypothetical protein